MGLEAEETVPGADFRTLVRTAEAIQRDFGDLDDLPRELANTISNIYFKLFLLAEGQMLSGRKRPAKQNLLGAVTEFSELTAHLTSATRFLPAMVGDLREMRSAGRLDIYQYSLDFMLDVFKFRIKKADEKRPITRRLERLFERPNEVKDLYTYVRQAMKNELTDFQIFG